MLVVVFKVFIIGNKNLSEVMDKQDKQDISEISDQIQKKIQIVLKKFRRIWLETIPKLLNITYYR